MPTAEPVRALAPSGAPTMSLDAVDIRPELEVRPRRVSSLADEHRAFAVLAAELAANPRNLLRKVVELSLDFATRTPPASACSTAMCSDGKLWLAFGRRSKAARCRGMRARAGSASSDTTQLMHLPDRCFPALFATPIRRSAAGTVSCLGGRLVPPGRQPHRRPEVRQGR